ncbi:MAG TPA: SDR family NAD(P)-dependent oxidoreductase [Stellaceae bacterium]|nr:SDR family NAD(P)-dependent oxidoreductase [Stellaceae bacterium]
MRVPLAGKTALITGAGSGIGQALAIEAAERGMILALTGRRAERLAETCARFNSRPACLIIPGDVTSPETRRAIRERIAKEWGRLHVVVNNAGIVAAGPLAVTQDAELDRLIATNLTAPIALTRELLPLLRAGAPARVVNIGSMLGDIALPLFVAYSASKFGLRGLSNALRRELKSLAIGVTYASPRGARTAATQAIAHVVEPLDMPLDKVETIARQVWDAVAAGRDVVYPRGRERLFVLLEKLMPSVVSRALNAQIEAAGMRPLIEQAAGFVGRSQPIDRAPSNAGGF